MEPDPEALLRLVDALQPWSRASASCASAAPCQTMTAPATAMSAMLIRN
jgi:hypothetical protein